MRPITLLAQEETGPVLNGNVFDNLNILHDPQLLLDNLARMPMFAAATVVTVGVLCIFNGYRWHKWVVAILALLCGVGLGFALSKTMGKPYVVAAAVGGICAMIATPMLKLTVAIFGGLTGAFIGSNAWSAFEFSHVEHHWAGALLGFIIVGMASLVVFKFVVVLFTSVGGAAMVVFGSITLLMSVPTWETPVRDGLLNTPMLVPLLLGLAAMAGFILQQSRLHSEGVRLFGADAEG